MSTINEITKLQHPATANRQVYSPLEAYWKAFQDWAQTPEGGEPSCVA